MAEKTVEYDKPFGGFAFSKKEIEANVLADESGTYLLSEGARDENNNLFVTYVGRAVVGESEDLRTRLKAHLNNPNEQKTDANALVGILKNNPTVRSLIRDDYAIEVALVSVFLNQILWGEELHRWYGCLVNQTYANLVLGRSYPSVGLDYLGLIDHMSTSHDEQYQKKVLPSSELVPMIFMISSALGYDDVCTGVVNIVERFLKECDFQVWFPEQVSEESFYTNQKNHGMQLVSQNLLDGKKFMETVFGECDKRRLPYACAYGAFGGLILLGCRVHRCPIPPHFVQLMAKADTMRKSKDGAQEN